MVQFCPKCGTRDPDDQAVFCNTCGNRLPLLVPEKRETICPGCGTKMSDIQAVFCDRCGSPLQTPPPVPVRAAAARPPAAPPVIKKTECPSCGAPFVDEISAYCNVCGARLQGPAWVSAAHKKTVPPPRKPASASLSIAREPAQHPAEKPAPVQPAAGLPGAVKGEPVPEKSRPPLLKWGLITLAAVIALMIIAAVLSGMIPGTSRSPDTTPAPAPATSGPAPTTPHTTHTTAPALTTPPAKTTATPVPATIKPADASAAAAVTATTTRAANATANVTAGTTTNGTANATAAVATTPALTNSSLPLAIGERAYDGKGNLAVHDVTFRDKMSDPVPSYAIGKKYLIINISYENVQQNETVDADLSRMRVTDGGGFPYDPASDSLLENAYTGRSILPRETRTGNLLFIVPPQATDLKLEYRSGNGNRVQFQVT